MNAEQKQRAAELLAAWRATAYALHGDRMADLLQELVGAPDAEPFAVIHLDGSFVHVEFKQPIAGTGKFEVYAAPPEPSVPDGWKLVPVEPTPEMMRSGMNVPFNKAARHNAVYRAMLKEAPQPPKLSDERIREIWVEHGQDDEDVEGFASAIEREILGGGNG